MNSWIFPEFYLIFINLFPYLKRQKGGNFCMNRGLMWRGTRADVTRHARPRGRAARAHAAPRWRKGGADAWQGPRESMRMPLVVPRGNEQASR